MITLDGTLPDNFGLACYRLTLKAVDELHLPPFKGSTLRGGFGINFRRMVCFQLEMKTCRPCLLRYTCPYPYLFESFPPQGTEVLSKNEYVTRPFVIEPPQDTRTEYAPGERLTFDLLLVGRAQQFLAYFLVTFKELGRAGLGRGRGRFRLARVEAVHPFTGEGALAYREEEPEAIQVPQLPVTAAEIETRAAALPTDEVRLRFLTPARLVYHKKMVQDPPFHVLVRRLLNRVSSLSYFHCGQRWETDFKGLIEQAKAVELAGSDTRWVQRERYSGRQQERVSLGGFVGEVVYQGNIAPFRALLLLGSLVHVGKATVFGNGKYEVRSQESRVRSRESGVRSRESGDL